PAAYSLDRHTVLVADEPGLARLVDAATGQQRGVPLRHPWDIVAVDYNADGTRVAVASHDRPFSEGGSLGTRCELYDAATGRPLAQPLPHPTWVQCLAFSPDSPVLATVCFAA